MITQGLEYYVFLVFLWLAVMLASVLIPCYGFHRKEWKGLGLGCLIQPFVVIVVCIIVTTVAYFNWKHNFCQYREDAMVAVRKAVVEKGDTLLHTWYLRPDEECLFEVRKPDPEDSDSIDYEDVTLFDVVYLEAATLGVEDCIVVRFDIDAHTVTATEYDEPLDIVRVNWPKVEAYFLQHGDK